MVSVSLTVSVTSDTMPVPLLTMLSAAVVTTLAAWPTTCYPEFAMAAAFVDIGFTNASPNAVSRDAAVRPKLPSMWAPVTMPAIPSMNPKIHGPYSFRFSPMVVYVFLFSFKTAS